MGQPRRDGSPGPNRRARRRSPLNPTGARHLAPPQPERIRVDDGMPPRFTDFVAPQSHSARAVDHRVGSARGFDRAHTTENEAGSVVLPVNDVSTAEPSPLVTAIRAANTVASLRTSSGSEN